MPWSYGQVLTTPFRLSGVPTPQDNQLVSRFLYTWEKGIGYARMRRSSVNQEGVGGLRDSSAETRFSSAIYPQLLAQAETHGEGVDRANHLKNYLDFNGDLWGLFEEEYDGADSYVAIVSRKYGATSDDWTGGGTIAQSGSTTLGMRIWDACVHKGRMIVLGNDGSAGSEVDAQWYYSADGASWTRGVGTGWPTTNFYPTAFIRQNSIQNNGGRCLDMGDRLLFAISDSANGNTVLYSSVDNGSNWVLHVTVESSQPVALLYWRDPFATNTPVAPVLVTAGNAFVIGFGDGTANDGTATTIFSSSTLQGVQGNAISGQWAAVGPRGELFLPLASGDFLKIAVLGEGAFDIKNIGPMSHHDGLVSSRQGYGRFVYGGDPQWLFVAYGGDGSGKFGSIFAYDYEASARLGDPVWHSFHLYGTENVLPFRIHISLEDDGAPRLHLAVDGASASTMVMFEQPLVSPTTGVTQNFTDGSVVQVPEDDMGDPNTTAGVYEAVIEADGLTAGSSGTDEYVDYATGTDSATWGTDDRGDFISTDKDLLFASGEGISANTIKHQLTLNVGSGDTTQAPKVKSFEMRAVNSQEVLRVVGQHIDMTKTSAEYDRSVEQQIAELEAIFTTATQVLISNGKTADWYGKVISPPQFDLRIIGEDRLEQEGYLEGDAFVPFTQLIEGV